MVRWWHAPQRRIATHLGSLAGWQVLGLSQAESTQYIAIPPALFLEQRQNNIVVRRQLFIQYLNEEWHSNGRGAVHHALMPNVAEKDCDIIGVVRVI